MPTRRNSHGRPERRRLEAAQRAEARGKRTDMDQAVALLKRTILPEVDTCLACFYGVCEWPHNQRELSRLAVDIKEASYRTYGVGG